MAMIESFVKRSSYLPPTAAFKDPSRNGACVDDESSEAGIQWASATSLAAISPSECSGRRTF